ncbi:MAG: cadherin repeat domain-containing protein [Myxococcota bacterium]
MPAIQPQSFMILESSLANTRVGTVAAMGDLTSLSFSILAGNDDNAFALDTTTGELTLLLPQDTETTPERLLTIAVTDTGGDPVAQAIMAVEIGDVAPVLPSNIDFTLDEMSAATTEVGTLHLDPAGDLTSVTLSIVGGSGAGSFAIDARTGTLTVVDPALDFEVTPSLSVDIMATDGTTEATTTATIHVRDSAPRLASPPTATIPETIPPGTVVTTLSVASGDTSSVRFILLDANGTTAFTVDTDGTVRVSPNAVLDFETRPSFSLSVGVSDQQGPLPIGPDDVAILTIDLVDIAPSIAANPTRVTVLEAAPAGTTVLTAQPEAGDPTPLHYSIVSGNTSGAFTIDSNTGEVTLAALGRLDAEGINPLPLEIGISDDPANGVDDTMTVLVQITDAPPVVLPTGPFVVSEAAPAGTYVGEIAIAPSGDTAGLVYSLATGNIFDAFAIDPDTGALTVSAAGLLDFEAQQFYTLEVVVSDGVTSDSVSVAIEVTDAPVLPISPVTISVSEGANVEEVIGRLQFHEGSDLNSLHITYLAGQQGGASSPSFRALSNGDIILNAEGVLDFETEPS